MVNETESKKRKDREDQEIGREEKRKRETTENFSGSLEGTVQVFKERNAAAVRKACKILRGKEESTEGFWGEAYMYMREWLGAQWGTGEFPIVVRPFFNLLISRGKPEQIEGILRPLFLIFQNGNLLGDEGCRKVLKFIFEKLAAEPKIKFCEAWEKFLEGGEAKIEIPFVCEWIKNQSRKGPRTHKNIWENFQAKFTLPNITTETSTQNCTITPRTAMCQRNENNNTLPKSIVVWNVNGMSARWSTPYNEVKKLQHAIGPDILCLLESKIASGKLLALQGFEDWVKREGFSKIFCHWSINEEQAPQGTEGILIFSKIPCSAVYGMGEHEFDKQARVVTLEFSEIFLIIPYNPQGGLKSHSIEYRARWEKAFEIFLRKMREKAGRKGKGLFGPGTSM